MIKIKSPFFIYFSFLLLQFSSDLLHCVDGIRVLDSPYAMAFSLHFPFLCFELQGHVFTFKGVQVDYLLLVRHLIKLNTFHLDQCFCVLANDVNDDARSIICKVNADRMTMKSFYIPFAIWTVVNSRIFPVSSLLAIFASMIKLLLGEVQHPATKISIEFTQSRRRFFHHRC